MYSREDKIKITEAFLESGLTLEHAGRRPGWPSRNTLSAWVREAREGKLPVRVAVPKGHVGVQSKHAHYSDETKREAIRLYEMGRRPADIARLLGMESSSSIRGWWKQAKQGVKLSDKQFTPKPFEPDREEPEMAYEIPEEVKKLSEAELEIVILRMVLADLKAETDLTKLSNRKKAEYGERLRRDFGLSLMQVIGFLKISKSSYDYQRARMCQDDPLRDVIERIIELFWENDARYGYRRICACLKRDGIRIADKVVRRIMKENGLVVRYEPKVKKWSSFKKDKSDLPDNLVKQDFVAGLPNFLWLTDLTEFGLPGFKCYLSPIIDCFDGLVVAWAISQSPNAELVNTMLNEALATVPEEQLKWLVLHNDHGVHYQWDDFIDICEDAGIHRSMSRKGNSPDNSRCEGFFGALKNEFFYHRSWAGITYDQFEKALNDYINWYNKKRMKSTLGDLSPVEYRQSLGIAA